MIGCTRGGAEKDLERLLDFLPRLKLARRRTGTQDAGKISLETSTVIVYSQTHLNCSTRIPCFFSGFFDVGSTG